MLVRAADSIAPIGTMWINAIRMTVIPLVVSLLIVGVGSASDVKAIGRIGGRTLLMFLFLLAGTAIVVIPLATILFRLLPQQASAGQLPAGAAVAAAEIATKEKGQTFSGWLISLVPSNPIAAAAAGEMIPLILFTLFLALAIASSPAPTREVLTGFFRAFSDAMLLLVRWVILVAPVGVFALVLPMAAHAGAAVAGGIGFYILAYSTLSIVVTLLLYGVILLATGIPMGRFARAALPAQLIAFSSSSSVASLPALIESAERRLILPTEVTGFVLPLAVSIFHIAGPVTWSVGALFVGWFYGIPLHVGSLVIITFAAVFLGFAGPGIPRGGFIMLAPLFLVIGLPVEGIGILIAVDAIPDTFSTVLNTTGDLAAATLVASFTKNRHDQLRKTSLVSA
jgi:proton glutamate symport protein